MKDLSRCTCGAELEEFNMGIRPLTCHPACGKKLSVQQTGYLWSRCCAEEIAEMIQEHVTHALAEYPIINSGRIPSAAWATELGNKAVFCSSPRARMFATRHISWVSDARDALVSARTGNFYITLYAENLDGFLAAAMHKATCVYMYGQLKLQNHGGNFTQRERGHIRQMMKENPYNGEW